MSKLVKLLENEVQTLTSKKEELAQHITDNFLSDLKSSQVSDAISKLFPTFDIKTSNRQFPTNVHDITIDIDGIEVTYYGSTKKSKYLLGDDLELEERRIKEQRLDIVDYSNCGFNYYFKGIEINLDKSLEEIIDEVTQTYNFKQSVEKLSNIINEYAVPFVEMYYSEFNDVSEELATTKFELTTAKQTAMKQWVDSVIEGNSVVTIQPKYQEEYRLIDSNGSGSYIDTSLRNVKEYGDKVHSVIVKEKHPYFGARFKVASNTKHEDIHLLDIKDITKKPRNQYEAYVKLYENSDYELVTFTKNNLEEVLSYIWKWNNGTTDSNSYYDNNTDTYDKWVAESVEYNRFNFLTEEQLMSRKIKTNEWVLVEENGKVTA